MGVHGRDFVFSRIRPAGDDCNIPYRSGEDIYTFHTIKNQVSIKEKTFKEAYRKDRLHKRAPVIKARIQISHQGFVK